MLFADFDWSQVLWSAVIGAIVGGVAGLAIWIVRRSTNKPPDDKDTPR